VQQLLQGVEYLGAGAQASRKLGAPRGTIMNSWKSSELSAWRRPLTMFIRGTGNLRAVGRPGSGRAQARLDRSRTPAAWTRPGWHWAALLCWACRRPNHGFIQARLIKGVATTTSGPASW